MATATTVWKDAKVELDDSGGSLVNLSDQAESVTVNFGANSETVNGMGDTTEITVPTILNWSIDITFIDSFGTGSVEEIVYDWISGLAAKTVQITKQDTTVSASNPKWTGEGVILDSATGGDFGGVMKKTVTIVSAGALTRATA